MAFSVGELVGYLRLEGGAAFDRQVGSAKRSLDLTGESATKAGAAIGKTEAKMAGAGQAAGRLSAESGKLRAAQLSVVAAQERYNALMAAGTGDTARLASAEAALIRSQMRLAAIKPPTDPGGLARMRASAVSTVATLGKLGLAFGVFELAVKGIDEIKAGNELTTALNGVQAAAQASDQQMIKVRATSVALGKDLTVPRATAVDAAAAIEDLVKSGVSLDRAMVAARPALLLAGAATVSIADAARITGKVLDDFRLPGTAAGRVADTLAAASNSAGGGLMGLSDAMKFAGPTARTVGIDVTMTAAALVLMAKSGHEGTIGGTAFANMLTRLAPVSKSAKEAMAELGVSAWDTQGKFRGLPVVVDQLHKAQERLSPEAFAKNVQIAFGNRARLAVFDFAHGGAAYLDTFYKKLKAGDVQEYANRMNRGLSAAGAQLRKEFTAWAIDLNQKVQPALAEATFWLGDNLPGAARRVQNTLQPLEHEMVAVFVPAWHVLATTLSAAGTGLNEVAGLLERHKGTVQVVGTVVLGLWAAWKGYTIAKTAVMAVSAAMDLLAVKAYKGVAAVSAISSGTASLSAGTLTLGGLGIALGVAAYAWQKHSAAVADSKHEIDDFTASVKADSGALGDNSRQVAFNALQKMGAVDAARKLGIGIDTLTSAALGNAGAMGLINQRLADFPNSSALSAKAAGMSQSAYLDLFNAADKVARGVDGTNSAVQKGVQGFKDQQIAVLGAAGASAEAATAHQSLATSLRWVTDATGNLSQVQVDASGKVNDTTEELVKEASAAETLKASLDALNGVNVSQEQTTNAFLDSIDSLTESVKTNGHSLDQNSTAGRKNREQMVSIIQAAKDQAQATADSIAVTDGQTAGLRAGNAQLKANEERLRTQAGKLGLSKKATDELIRSLGKLDTMHPAPTTDIKTAPAQAKIVALQKQIDAIRQGKPTGVSADTELAKRKLAALQAEIDNLHGKNIDITVNQSVGRVVHDAVNSIPVKAVPGGRAPARASGGGVSDGWFTMNEQGWELGRKQGSKLEIYSHQQSKKMLPQGPSVPAYASGSAPKVAPVQVRTLLETAGGGQAYGIASYIVGQIPSVRSAAKLLAAAVDDELTLKGLRAQAAGYKSLLEKLRDLQQNLASGVTTKLSDGADPSQFGSVQQYTAFLQAKADQNARYITEVNKLRGNRAIPAAVLARVAAEGASPALDSLAGASRSDVAALVKASARFDSSVKVGAGQAAAIYTPSISHASADLKAVSDTTNRLASVVAQLALAVSRKTDQPVKLYLDNKEVASTKYVQHQLQGFADNLRHILVTGHADH